MEEKETSKMEIECLIISSDEEDDNEKSKQFNDSKDNILVSSKNNNDTIFVKEPIVTDETIFALNKEKLDQAAMEENDDCKNDQSNLSTFLCCRSVRIGSYNYVPNEDVEVTNNGLKLKIPLLENDKNSIAIDIKLEDMIAVLIHFGQTTPVLFFYLDVQTGLRIKDALGMQDPKNSYFDPFSKELTQKSITLLPERINDESKVILKRMYGDIFTELNNEEANDILVRASIKSVQTKDERKQPTPSCSEIQTIIVYPSPSSEERVIVDTKDYLSLAEDQWLSDGIINFYLKYLQLEILSPIDRARTHVFSSFFYTCLTKPLTQPEENTKKETAATRRHARIKGWTKNVNLFDKDFIVIPIYKDSHWFLAIICFPGLVGKVMQTVDTKTTITPETSAEFPQESNQINKIPCILLFDSIVHPCRSHVMITLRDYLSCEYKAKFGTEKEFSKDTIKGAYPKVPRQPNFTDCGLYVLQYAENFFLKPITDYKLPIETLENWFEEIVVTRKREELANLLKNLIDNTKRSKPLILPNLIFSTQN